jgi:chromosome segregation ATPase
MRLVRLEASNFKRIRAVAINPDRSVVRIHGKNSAGKSSLLDAIAALLGGEKLCPKEPIRRGESEAIIRGTLDQFPEFGQVVVERRFKLNAEGEVASTLKLFRDDGAKLDKPQRRLDELLGSLAFDPLAFTRLLPKDQAETLRRLAGVDFSLLDARRAKAYEARTVANRQVTQLKARLAATPPVVAPDEPVSAADLYAEQERRTAEHSENEKKRLALQDLRGRHERLKRDVADREVRIAELEKRLADERAALAKAEAELDENFAAGVAMKAVVEALVEPDLKEIPAKVRELDVVNEGVRAKKARVALEDELRKADAEAKRLDAEVTSIDQQKAEALAEAHLPVPGLAFDESGVTFEGFPFEQASQSQQLRISIAIGAALSPTLRAMLVRDGSLLDEESLALLEEEATAKGLQVFLEQVGSEGEGILIVDGEVAAAPAEVAHAG